MPVLVRCYWHGEDHDGRLVLASTSYRGREVLSRMFVRDLRSCDAFKITTAR